MTKIIDVDFKNKKLAFTFEDNKIENIKELDHLFTQCLKLIKKTSEDEILIDYAGRTLLHLLANVIQDAGLADYKEH